MSYYINLKSEDKNKLEFIAESSLLFLLLDQYHEDWRKGIDRSSSESAIGCWGKTLVNYYGNYFVPGQDSVFESITLTYLALNALRKTVKGIESYQFYKDAIEYIEKHKAENFLEDNDELSANKGGYGRIKTPRGHGSGFKKVVDNRHTANALRIRLLHGYDYPLVKNSIDYLLSRFNNYYKHNKTEKFFESSHPMAIADLINTAIEIINLLKSNMDYENIGEDINTCNSIIVEGLNFLTRMIIYIGILMVIQKIYFAHFIS
jgi:hypothetical protein